MKYINFKKLVSSAVTFSPLDYLPHDHDRNTFGLQISQWKKNGLILPLKRNLYLLNEDDRKFTPSRLYLANQMVFPSYVSLETALSLYGMIPERVYAMTSVTSKKTKQYSNSFGTFTFRSLQPFRYFGYHVMQDEHKMPVFIADKEKAFLDFLYFRLPAQKSQNTEILTSFRMENVHDLDRIKLRKYVALFRSRKLSLFMAAVENKEYL